MNRVWCMLSKRPDFAPAPSARTVGAAGGVTCAKDTWALKNMKAARSPALAAFDDEDAAVVPFIDFP